MRKSYQIFFVLLLFETLSEKYSVSSLRIPKDCACSGSQFRDFGSKYFCTYIYVPIHGSIHVPIHGSITIIQMNINTATSQYRQKLFGFWVTEVVHPTFQGKYRFNNVICHFFKPLFINGSVLFVTYYQTSDLVRNWE